MSLLGSVDAARNTDRAGRRIRVLILVKASPQPSKQYGDTVCVAGVALDGPLRWVRLYPVPFRYLEGAKRFKKYDVVTVTVRNAGADKRPESLKINADGLGVETHLSGWERRSRWVEPMVDVTMCEVQAAVRRDINSQSLAAVRPAAVHDLELTPHGGWTADQLKKFEAYANQGDLFRETPPTLLDAPRFKARLHYTCAETGCQTHTQTVIDWELTALQHRERRLSDADLKAMIRKLFFDQMYSERKRPVLFVGNQENPARRASFTVLGSYYPNADQAVVDVPLF